MWISPSEEHSAMLAIYRREQFFLAEQRIAVLRFFKYDPAEMTVREIYEIGQELIDFQPKYSIMDAARIKQVATKNSVIGD
jgi:hypothetical protein